MKWVTAVINRQEVKIAFDENSIHIYNAYPIKDDLKMRGYRWNPADKSWYFQTEDVESEMALLKNNLQNTALPASVTPKKTELAVYPNSYSVAELRNRLDQLIKQGIKGNIWVHGVIASEIKTYQWASYLDLKDEDENRGIFFRVEIKRQQLEKIKRKLKESGAALNLERDLPVFCHVEVHLPLRNVVDIRLTLLDILPEYTQARLRNQRDITIEQLKKEGVFENQKQLILPRYISRLGLITSEQGTSIKDIKAGLNPYANKYSFLLGDSRMEGANAVDSIIDAIDFFENNRNRHKVEALIIARGGGSEQSLAIFNDLRLCRKVCNCSIPVLTAIGHEKDNPAIELCSWLTPTPSTPSGIGKYLQNRYFNLEEQLKNNVTRLMHHFNTVQHREIEKINSYLKNLPIQLTNLINLKEERFLTMIRGLEQSTFFTVRDHQRRIAALAGQLFKKNREKLSSGKKGIELFASIILSRIAAIRKRESIQMEKAIAKLDFKKIDRYNQKKQKYILSNIRNLFSTSHRKINLSLKTLEDRIQLIKANDLHQILKKGFTLTLDQHNRVIKSLREFQDQDSAILKFHDGTVWVTEKKNATAEKTLEDG